MNPGTPHPLSTTGIAMSRSDQALVGAIVFAIVVFFGGLGILYFVGETIEQIGQYQEQGR